MLFLDGAMGTMIQQYRLKEDDFRGERFKDLPVMQTGNNDLLTLSRPDIVEDIHRKYLEAGADIIETNTFNAQRISMADYHCEALCKEMNLRAAQLAQRLAREYTEKNPNKPRWVAGSIGPTNKTCSMSPDANDPAMRTLTFDELCSAYTEQITALIEGGVDLLLIETIFDTLNAKAALFAAKAVMRQTREIPVMLSVTIADKGGRTLSGQTLEAFLTSIAHYPIFSVGLNCSFGAAEMKPYIEKLSATVPYYLSAYPNAGLPNDLGTYDQTPEQMATLVRNWADKRLVNIVGGCCGTTHHYIAHIVQAVETSEQYRHPRTPAEKSAMLCLSGLENMVVNTEEDFVKVGERCNVAGSKKFLRLIKEQQYDEAIEIARAQIKDGAQVLDINLDDGLLDGPKEITHFLHLIASEPDICRVPMMIDSSNWDVIQAALKCVQGKCIVNSLSLKEGEAEFLQRARFIQSMGAAVVVMAFDENGQADTYERRIEVCERAYHLLTKEIGFQPSDILFDPNILAVCTGIPEHDSYALDFIAATQWIKTHLKGCHVCGGISNLSFAFRGNQFLRDALHTVFLHHAVKSGMDFCIINPKNNLHYDRLPIDFRQELENIVLNKQPSVDAVLALSEKYRPKSAETTPDVLTTKTQEAPATAKEKLKVAIVKGEMLHLEKDLQEELQLGTKAIDIVEHILMAGMNIVGELFGQGKMYLPQVVKAARTMKRAVDILQPHIEQEKVVSQGHRTAKILMATVKGDVHDIGKNIVSLILSCNNYEIIDLGVMCPADKIVQAAKEHQVDMIGLSGLITPSLKEMQTVAQEMERNGMQIPLIIGGATTSRKHTALHIAPEYSGPTVWVKDASKMVDVAYQLIHATDQKACAQRLMEHTLATSESASITTPQQTIEEARNNKLNLFN